MLILAAQFYDSGFGTGQTTSSRAKSPSDALLSRLHLSYGTNPTHPPYAPWSRT